MSGDTNRSKPSSAGWQVVIGLEIHAQLATRTKLFCGCANSFGARPNAHTCPVCTGQPGALPVLNEEALALALRAALALGAEIAPVSRFARKNYFYCDLPKGYQISQSDEPYCRGGSISLPSGESVRFERIHLEEDAGKAVHDQGPRTLVDLNRGGVPLIEAVTLPDLRSADDAVSLLEAYREILRYAKVSEGDMEKGHLRFDVNVSVRPDGEPLRERVELKNLNSFRHVRAAVEHEFERQVRVYEEGGTVPRETRGFDPAAGTTFALRSKEDAQDYRYFPDPDLTPLVVSAEAIERERRRLPELPNERRQRFAEAFGLSDYDARVLTDAPQVADFFEAVVAAGGDQKLAANWIANDVLGALSGNGDDLDQLGLKAPQLAALLSLVEDETLSTAGGRRVFEVLLERGGDPRAIVDELGLKQISDPQTLERWCREALAQAPKAAAQVRAGKAKAMGALVGPVMKASRGKANPELVTQTLRRLIAEGDAPE